jgi:hypothetical protein
LRYLCYPSSVNEMKEIKREWYVCMYKNINDRNTKNENKIKRITILECLEYPMNEHRKWSKCLYKRYEKKSQVSDTLTKLSQNILFLVSIYGSVSFKSNFPFEILFRATSTQHEHRPF